MDPSPTAEATRLMLPARTSPTANTPGRLVSSRYGGRVSGQLRVDEIVGGEVRAGLDEPFVIERDAAVEPVGVGRRAGHHEHVADVVALDRAVRLSRQRTRSRCELPFECHDLRVRCAA